MSPIAFSCRLVHIVLGDLRSDRQASRLALLPFWPPAPHLSHAGPSRQPCLALAALHHAPTWLCCHPCLEHQNGDDPPQVLMLPTCAAQFVQLECCLLLPGKVALPVRQRENQYWYVCVLCLCPSCASCTNMLLRCMMVGEGKPDLQVHLAMKGT